MRTDDFSMADALVGFADSAPTVRARTLQLVARQHPHWWEESSARLTALLADGVRDPDPMVVEMACFAAGECLAEFQFDTDGVVGAICEVCAHHPEPLCRESAAAALGAIANPLARDTVLGACTDKVTIRRRAVLALVSFDGPEVDAMLTTLLSDVDWQVRQAAEDLSAID